MATNTETKTRTPEEVAHEAFAAFKARDIERVAACWHEDVVEEVVPVGIYRGRAEATENLRGLLEAGPDFEVSLVRIVADEHHAVMEWRGTGTFSGDEPYNGIVPNGKPIEMRVIEMLEIEDGLIVRNTIYYDNATFGRQIGMLPEEGSAAEKAMVGAFNAVTKLRKAIDRRKAAA
jgi:steroid delta-isomerase-like uncharacterized protein